jgi:serine/threonine protein kinase
MFEGFELCSSRCKGVHTGGVGTPSYASPEQLNGKNYDFKTDIYSCGLILFEMFHPCTTFSERAACFRDIRKSRLPSKMLQHYPVESAMILWLVSADPADRPSTEGKYLQFLINLLLEILHSDLFTSLEEDVTILRNKLIQSQKIIQTLSKRITELEEQLKEKSSNDLSLLEERSE